MSDKQISLKSSSFGKPCLPGLAAVLLVFCLAAGAAQEPLKVTISPMEKMNGTGIFYFSQLLELALKKTEPTHGPYTLGYAATHVSAERDLADLKRGVNINVAWTTINGKRNKELLPIRISLIRELNNYRIFLIGKDEQDKFDRVQSLNDLRKLRAGLGSNWPDVEVMRNNGLPVVTSPTHQSLFKMLAVKRFDYFPRGLYEIWNELELHQDLGLRVEQKLMIYYEAPFYYFVNKKDVALAERIEQGLKLAMADGSFDALMESVPSYKRGLEEQRTSNRKLFVLEPLYDKYQE
jgi:hypothetical protein